MRRFGGVAAIIVAMFLGGANSPASAQQRAQVAIDSDDIGGVVRGPNGPEAGAERPGRVSVSLRSKAKVMGCGRH
jgi:hypothetical protein